MSALSDRMSRFLRADVQGMHGYAVQPSAGFVKVDTMENPFRLPDALRKELGERLAEVTASGRSRSARAGRRSQRSASTAWTCSGPTTTWPSTRSPKLPSPPV